MTEISSDEIQGKSCSGCGLFKPLTEFVKSTTEAKDGYTYRCKECRNEYRRKKYATDQVFRQKKSDYAKTHGPERTDEKRKHEREIDNKRRADDPERFREKNRRWYGNNPDRVKELKKKYAENPLQKIDPGEHKVCHKCKLEKPVSDFRNSKRSRDGLQTWCKECQNAYSREKFHNDAEFRKKSYAKAKRWASNNVDKSAEISRDAARKYRKEHPDAVSECYHNHRALLVGNGGKHTAAEWQALKDKYDNRCLCCGRRVKLTRDHINPLIKGGTNDIDNIQPLCLTCNTRKGTEYIDYRNPFVAMAT